MVFFFQDSQNGTIKQPNILNLQMYLFTTKDFKWLCSQEIPVLRSMLYIATHIHNTYIWVIWEVYPKDPITTPA